MARKKSTNTPTGTPTRPATPPSPGWKPPGLTDVAPSLQGPKYVYRYEWFVHSDVEMRLNALGALGWRLVACYPRERHYQVPGVAGPSDGLWCVLIREE